jgi:hypothetical protein
MARLLRSIGELRLAGKGTAQNDAKHGMQLKGTWLHFVGTIKKRSKSKKLLAIHSLFLCTCCWKQSLALFGNLARGGSGRSSPHTFKGLSWKWCVVVRYNFSHQFDHGLWSTFLFFWCFRNGLVVDA